MVAHFLRATPGDDASFGVLNQLHGTWRNSGSLAGHGWNLIALPFGPQGELGDFRLLLNQFNETLDFTTVDAHVPNRGNGPQDQHVAAMQYIQSIDQIAAIDAASTQAGGLAVPATLDTDDTPKGSVLPPPAPPNTKATIHHEPGLLLLMEDQTDDGPTLARLASIPHGDSVLALGSSSGPVPGAPNFKDQQFADLFSALPVGAGETLIAGKPSPYFAPYLHFSGDNKFQGLLDPLDPRSLLAAAVPAASVKNTTTILLSTAVKFAGINNIPFVTLRANATSMSIAMWIQELNDGTNILQYVQKVMLKFLPRTDGVAGQIEWPHISFNSMVLQE